MKCTFIIPVLAALSAVAPAQAQRGQYSSFAGAALPGPDDPVLAGYDLVEYHNLHASQDGVVGRVEFSHRHTNGYLYYFADDANRQSFIADPERYLPQYGGFCAWGVAWEYAEDGWPWAPDHMGPPCGPRDGWAVIGGKLYCSIWRSYQDDFNRRSGEGIRLADERWIGYYGSLSAGPQNNGCYSWNWQECFARSIYAPGGGGGSPQASQVEASQPSSPQTDVVTAQPTPTPEALFTDEHGAKWSSPRTAMEGIITWRWTLDDVATVSPRLIVDVEATDIAADEYVAFGVAEQLMQGALVVCSEMIPTTTSTPGEEEEQESSSSSAVVGRVGGGTPSAATATGCTTLVGQGMGTTVPRTDPVRPEVLLSSRNDTHYSVRFSASLFGCWATPELPARVLFARGGVSGNGAPQPHVNDGRNREAIPGIEFLSVVYGYDSDAEQQEDVATTPDFAELEPLPPTELWDPIPGTGGATDILDGRVRVSFEMFIHEGVEIISIELQNVEFVSEETYIGFGFAGEVMTGLVLTCAPRLMVADEDGSSKMNATCHQWRGQGTNLLPRRREVDPGGWFVSDVAFNGTHVNYTLAGRAAEVVQAHDGGRADGSPLSSVENLRAICAIGRSAPESGTPLMHDARDRVAFSLYGQVRSDLDKVPRNESASVSAASSLAKWFGRKVLLTLALIPFLFR